ncbi:tyrosine-type recombinase/integrase [Sediminicola arcticus]|uniref:Site-specific integrase n=1 Tax=Sediminicola arcticus TaxID=1574308 RepID=A0ABV2SWC7_9FLAO
MATINFLVKGKDNPATINLRFVHGRKFDFTKSTGFLINPKDWSPKKKMPNQRDEVLKKLTTDLQELSNDIIKSFNNTPLDEIGPDWLQYQIDLSKGIVKPQQSRSDLLDDCIKHIIDTANIRENSKGGLGLSKSRVNSYKNLQKIFNKYQGSNKYRVRDVDIKFGREFLDWMLSKQNYSESYARKKIDDLKTVCRDAELDGIIVSAQLRKIKGGKPKKEYIVYLNPQELKKIEKANVHNNAYQNARKWLLLGCNIGQRGGDLLKLTKNNFFNRNGLEVIELKQQKTGKQVIIPLSEETKEIIKDGFPRPIAIQNFNEYIKDICRIAGIDEMTEGVKSVMVDSKGNEIIKDEKGKYVSKGVKRNIKGIFPKYELVASHVCRRSFATNLYGDLPTPLIMQITAHSTEKMFLNYIGKDSLDYAQQIADMFALLTQKKKKESTLEIVQKRVNE